MNDDGYSLQHVEIQRAEHSLRYENAKPGGALHIVYCIASVLLLMFIQGAFTNIAPNLILVFIILISMKTSGYKPLVLAGMSGLLVDVVYGMYYGLYALMFLYTAMLFTLVIKRLFEVRVKTKICFVCIPFFFAFRITESFVLRLLSVIFENGTVLYTNYFIHFLNRILPNVIVNEIALILMIVPVFALWRRTSPH